METNVTGTDDLEKSEQTEVCYGFEEGTWVFDDKVVKNWQNEMDGHIPGYWDVINLSADIVERIHGKSARILNYWAATGNQFIPYQDKGWDPENFMGMNYSEAHDQNFRERFPDCPNRQISIEKRPYNPLTDAPFDVVQMHWSLHFEPLDKRGEVLQQIYDSLNEGGTLLLTDKTKQSEVVEGLYHDFKRAQGVSDEEIDAKKKAIIGVLEPLPSHWYEDVLKKTGFVDICVVHAQLGFVTWLARKPG